jgi:hypothetical protein
MSSCLYAFAWSLVTVATVTVAAVAVIAVAEVSVAESLAVGVAAVTVAAVAVIAVAVLTVAVSVVAVDDISWFMSVAVVVKAAATVIEASFSRLWVRDRGRGLLFGSPGPCPWPSWPWPPCPWPS